MKKANKVYSLVFMIVTILVGIAFILTADIIIFSTSSHRLDQDGAIRGILIMLVPSTIWILMVIGAYVFSRLVPTVKQVNRPYDNNQMLAIRKTLLNKDFDKQDTELIKSYKAITKKRYVCLAITIAIDVICLSVILLYLTHLAFFPVPSEGEQVNMLMDFFKMLFSLFPVIMVGFVTSLLCYMYFDKTSKDLIIIVNKLLKEQGTTNSNSNKNEKLIWILRGSIFSIAVAFIIIGYFNGGATDVLNKAIKICKECIGIG